MSLSSVHIRHQSHPFTYVNKYRLDSHKKTGHLLTITAVHNCYVVYRFKMPYLPNLSMFPDCSNTSQTQATCSWVKPSGAMALDVAATEAMVEVDTEAGGPAEMPEAD